MPIYSYYCRECDDIFDEIVPMTERGEPQPCPDCGTESERRLTGANFKFRAGDGSADRDCDAGRRKQKEDDWVARASSRARKLKERGEVPMNEPITFKDRRIQD